ncbi:MAG: sigma-70 family RNA polymerase sigma factor [Dehalococcoidia bacterium]|nr:sigma-70 family RNA polymerase sigma factor [Dehalococcoidia bacterium]
MQQLEAALIEAARSDSQAFAELVVRYQDRLYNYLYRMTGSREDAQDLTQEAFVRVYQALPRFHLEAPFRPWLYKIATNLAINQLKGRKPAIVLEDYVPSRALDDSPERQVETHEVQRIIAAAIAELPDTYRPVVLMRHVEELSYDEIGKALDLPIGTVKVRLHRARAALQAKLAAAGLHQAAASLRDAHEPAVTQ